MFSIALQAGGQSSRMGEDKALMAFCGIPLIERVLFRVKSLSKDIFITSNERDAYKFLHVPVYQDIYPGKGALGGIISAMSFAKMKILVILACDLPFVNPELLKAQAEMLLRLDCDVVIPRSPGGLEPLHSVFRVDRCLSAALEALLHNEKRVISWFNNVRVSIMETTEIRKIDPDFRSFLNVNTPTEFKSAERLAELYDQEPLPGRGNQN
jgi:molybdopterin-guanine dinucleotide biosynthesis protein A